MIDPTKLSGRELDAAVAEHIYGWKWATTYNQVSSLLMPSVHEQFVAWGHGYRDGKIITDNLDIDGVAFNQPPVPSYSGDDTLALQAADKVGLFFPKGYTLLARQDTFAEVDDPPIWIVATEVAIYAYHDGMEPEIEGIATGTTRAEALCRAALILALEGKR